MKTVLVICTGNSCRSQLAEGYLRHFAGDRALIFSAGLETHGVNPRAIATMKDDGIDISSHTSNNISEYMTRSFDYVISVCDHAEKNCPVFPGNAIRIHQAFPDPAKATGTESSIQEAFEKVRDQVKEFCRKFVAEYL